MNLYLKLSILTAILALGTACVPELAPPQPPPEPTQPPTESPTATQSPSETPVATTSPTSSPTDSMTPSPTPSATPTATATPTAIPTPTATVDPNLDFDGDGFTTLEGDCAPRDPDIYPGAFDMPFDGQDGNCNGVQDQITQILGSTLNEGGDARYARMDNILDVEVASDGTIYISDDQLCSIRQIKDGLITTLIGNNHCVTTGDGGHMSQAGVSRVQAMAIDERRERLYYITVGEIWYLDLQTKIVHHFAGNRDSYDVIEAIEGIPPDEVYFEDHTLAIDDRWGTLYFVSNYALFQLETDPQYYDRLQLLMGTPGEPGLPTEGEAKDSLMMQASDLQYAPTTDTFYLNLRAYELSHTHGYIGKVANGVLEIIAGQDDECHREYRKQTGDYGHPDTQDTIDGLENNEIMFCNLSGLKCVGDTCYASDKYHLYELSLPTNSIERLATESAYNPPGYIDGVMKSFEEGPLDKIDISPIGKMAFDPSTNSILWTQRYNQLLHRIFIPDNDVIRVAGYGPNGHYSDGIHKPLIGRINQILTVPTESDEIALYLTDVEYNTVLLYQGDILTPLAGRVGIDSGFENEGPATETALNYPDFITKGDDGSLYIYSFDFQIFRLKDEQITVVAGGGEEDFGAALSVALEWPQPFKFDAKTGKILILQTQYRDQIVALEFDESGTGVILPFINFPIPIESHGISVDPGSISEFEVSGDDTYLLTVNPPTLMRHNSSDIEAVIVPPDTNAGPLYLEPETESLRGLTLSGDGTIYFTDPDNGILYLYRPQNNELHAIHIEQSQYKSYMEASELTGISIPLGVPTASHDGSVYINNKRTGVVYQIVW